MLQRINIIQTLGLDEFQILPSIVILCIWPGFKVQLLIISKQLIIVVQWQVIVELLVQTYACLVCPAPRHILYRVASTTEDHQREAPFFDKFHTGTMTS